jgi:predicted metal-dependent phosphoesterase TrpH
LKKPLASDAHAGIDLHVHSTASDGTLSPTDILAMAVRSGLKAISITDHDTLSGTIDALKAGIPSSLQFLTGIEISAAPPDGYRLDGSVHVLGYGIDSTDARLHELLGVLNAARKQRNPQIIDRLNAMGLDLCMADLTDIVGDATAGRPHIAQLLVQRGMAASIDDAFDRFLGKNQPAYVDKYRVPMQAAIDAIDHAGGIAVLAHPFLNGITDPTTFETFLVALKSMGLRGIEAIYPDHSKAITAEYCRLAAKHGLLITGGTDFHGDVTPGIQMGIGKGGMHVPYSLYQTLVEHLDTHR